MPGTILFARHPDLGLVEGYVLTRALGPRPVKGVEAPLEVFELVGAAPIRYHLHHRGGTADCTHFVGARLRDRAALERAQPGAHRRWAARGGGGRAGRREVPGCTGSSSARASPRAGSCCVASGVLRQGYGISAVIDLLRAYYEIGERDEARVVREKVTRQAPRPGRIFRPALVPLLVLLGVPGGDPVMGGAPGRRTTAPGPSTPSSTSCCAKAASSPLSSCSRTCTWIDDETQRLLDALIESLPDHRLLLLVDYPPRVSTRLGRQELLHRSSRRRSAGHDERPSCSTASSAPARSLDHSTECSSTEPGAILSSSRSQSAR